MPKAKITAKEQKFIDEYVAICNGAKAARRAGYAEKNARCTAYDLLAKSHIRDAVELRRAQLRKKIEVDREKIVQELAAIAFARSKHFSEWSESGVKLHPSEDLDDNDSAAVKKIKQVATEHGTNVELELHGKTESLHLLAKILGIVDGKPDDGPDDPSVDEARIRGAVERLKR